MPDSAILDENTILVGKIRESCVYNGWIMPSEYVKKLKEHGKIALLNRAAAS